MNTLANTSQARIKSQGWAALGVKHGLKQPQLAADDPFPPLPTNNTSHLLPSQSLKVRSFSSVVRSSADFPPIVENFNSSLIDVTGGDNRDVVLTKLQQLHSWADQGLIEDVMAMVDDDSDKASALLKDLVTSYGSKVKCDMEEKNISDCCEVQCKKGENERSLIENTSDLAADMADLSSTLEDALKIAHGEFKDMHTSHGQMLSEAAAANMKVILGHLKSLPVEPEWEENDIYMSHRRNALKMMRLASRHSRAATNAFIRGDHFTVQQQSLKARKEWLDAEILNAKAAKEILSLRNSEDNPWKLDLHGLHVAEAVQALQEHLQKLETQLPMDRQLAPSGARTKDGIVCSLNVPFVGMNLENANVHFKGIRQRPASLQVITGVGNHSHGQASLPAAVRNFLTENRYKFDEMRPGVITVYPKFHHL